MLYYEAKDRESEAQFTREQLTQLDKTTVGFKGQSIKEKLKEDVVYSQNPLQKINWKEFGKFSKLFISI